MKKIMFGKECDCMKKRMLFVFAIILIVVLCVSAWFYGYYSQKSNDNIPSKESMVSYYKNQGVDYVTERLRGYKYTQLREVWGKPNNTLSGVSGDIWETNNMYSIMVYYDRNGVVEQVQVAVVNED